MKKLIIIVSLWLCVGVLSAFAENQKGNFSDSQICMAAIALMNGHPPVYDRVSSVKNEVTLHYTRNRDNRKFIYGCHLSGSEVKWRLHPQSTWSKNNQLFFAVNGNSVSIRQVVLRETVDSKTFQIGELQQ